MLQFDVVAGPAADDLCLSDAASSITQPSMNHAVHQSITAVSSTGVTLNASGTATSADAASIVGPAEPEVVSSDSRDVMLLPTVGVDEFPVVSSVVVGKKRGRKPKRRRRTPRAAADSLDYCNSVHSAPDDEQQQRPAPKKRGRKPKLRPEVAVVDDFTDSSVVKWTSEPTGEQATAALSTSTGNGSTIVDVVAVSGSTRRRGRKRKMATSALEEERRQLARDSVDDGLVQSVWKVTSPVTSEECSGHVVPRIKVTNVRLSAETTAGSSDRQTAGPSSSDRPCASDAGQRPSGSGPRVTGVEGAAGSSERPCRSGAGLTGVERSVMSKSWRPVVTSRRGGDVTTVTSRRGGGDVTGGSTVLPVLAGAREWIDATPKPCHADWTGPVFPAREMVHHVGASDLDTASRLGHVDEPAVTRSSSQRLSAADVLAGRPQAAVVDARSQLMYVLSTATEQAVSHPVTVQATSTRAQCSTAVQCSNGVDRVNAAASEPRSSQFLTQRVRLSRLSSKTDVTPAILSHVFDARQSRIEQRCIQKTSRATVRRAMTQRATRPVTLATLTRVKVARPCRRCDIGLNV